VKAEFKNTLASEEKRSKRTRDVGRPTTLMSLRALGPSIIRKSGDSTKSALPRWKRGLDVVVVIIVFPCFVVMCIVAGIMVGMSGGGPIFFRQQRVGYLGRKFVVYKFRTMSVRTEVRHHELTLRDLMRSNKPMQKLDARGDSRLISGGWFLRASGLDELPQVINIIRGDMSVVGPRPAIAYEYEAYSALQKLRLESVPGITGLWQVSGKNRTTFEEMINLDIQYGRNLSLWLDVKILLLTIVVPVKQLWGAWRSRRRG
jgi:lipopolysaccharide/colanic/teichoic acid biosynthesis glycosyltransferase